MDEWMDGMMRNERGGYESDDDVMMVLEVPAVYLNAPGKVRKLPKVPWSAQLSLAPGIIIDQLLRRGIGIERIGREVESPFVLVCCGSVFTNVRQLANVRRLIEGEILEWIDQVECIVTCGSAFSLSLQSRSVDRV